MAGAKRLQSLMLLLAMENRKRQLPGRSTDQAETVRTHQRLMGIARFELSRLDEDAQ